MRWIHSLSDSRVERLFVAFDGSGSHGFHGFGDDGHVELVFQREGVETRQCVESLDGSEDIEDFPLGKEEEAVAGGFSWGYESDSCSGSGESYFVPTYLLSKPCATYRRRVEER
jgi:hypothetical protein